jgi:DNA-binding phage protein
MAEAARVVTVEQLFAYLREHRGLWPVAKIAREAKLPRSVVHAAVIQGKPAHMRTVDKIVRAVGGRILVELTGPNRLLD